MKVKKKSYVTMQIVIAVLAVLVVALGVFSVYSFKQSKKNSSLYSDSAGNLNSINGELSSYKEALSQKDFEIESYSRSVYEQNSAHESEKADLNNTISELNKQIKIKKDKEASNNLAPAPAPIPTPAPQPGAGGKTIYLTFDDGPSPNTPKVLKILNDYGVKATFFVVNSKYNNYMKDIVANGHAIGLHSYTHDYKGIYSSDAAFYDDLQKISDVVYANTGVRSNISRFPGGSSNTVSRKYCSGIMSRVTKGVESKGYAYFDWNLSSGDASSKKLSSDQIYVNCTKLPKSNSVIVLMHDSSTKTATVEALPRIIEYYQSCGYSFASLSNDSPTSHQHINN